MRAYFCFPDSAVPAVAGELGNGGWEVFFFPQADEALRRALAGSPCAAVFPVSADAASREQFRRAAEACRDKDIAVAAITEGQEGAPGTLELRLACFEDGADDVLPAGMNPAEAAARLKAALRRISACAPQEVLKAGAIELDPGARTASCAGTELRLTSKEFDLLKFLMSFPGRVHPRNELISKVWGYNYLGTARTVDVHVTRLRNKLGAEGWRINTVHCDGYRFIAAGP